MTLLAIEHVQLAMPPGEEAKARAFYGELLGLPEVAKPAHLAARGGVWFEAGPVKVHLGVEDGFRPARKAHPAFVVDDLDRLVARLRAAGCEVTDDTPLAGWRRTYTWDLFGNRIELMEVQPADAS